MADWRNLTSAEIATAQLIFGNALNYQKIKIYCGIPYLPWLSCAVSPNGHIYFPKQHCPADFTQAPTHYLVWFMHELTHVWQWQLGFRTWLGGSILALRGGYYQRRAYRYTLTPDSISFAKLNMEQQAEVVAHYFAARYCHWEHHACQLDQLQTILQPLLTHPANPNLLPRYFGHSLSSHTQP